MVDSTFLFVLLFTAFGVGERIFLKWMASMDLIIVSLKKLKD